MESNSSSPGAPLAPIQHLWGRFRPVLGRAVRAAIALMERALHPWRRKRARLRLARGGSPGEILVLCYGNICRSPYAASFLERALRDQGLDTTVGQGGFFGPDRPAHGTALAVARDRGVDLEAHRSRLVTAAEAERASLVIVMEWGQARRMEKEFGVRADRILILGDLDPDPIGMRRISDPYGERPEVFVETYDRIDRCIRTLVALLPATPPPEPRPRAR